VENSVKKKSWLLSGKKPGGKTLEASRRKKSNQGNGNSRRATPDKESILSRGEIYHKQSKHPVTLPGARGRSEDCPLLATRKTNRG